MLRQKETKDREEIPDGPRLKIERAKHHINDLNSQVNTYLSGRPMKLVFKQDRKTAMQTLEIKVIKPIPTEFGAIIGDALHNLRSALDLFAFHLVGSLAKNPDQVYFPFAKTADKLSEVIDNRQMHLAGTHVAKAIAELKPYPNGNPLLSGLHSLDITDKHKIVIPTFRTANFSADDIKKNMPEANIEGSGILRFTGEAETAVKLTFIGSRKERRSLQSFEKVAEFQPEFEVCFGSDTPFELQPVVPKLEEIAGEVERAIRHVMAAKPTP